MYPPGQKHDALRHALETPTTFATTLVAILLDSYGTDFLTWDPETVAKELSDDFNARMPRINLDKINAMTSAMTTDLFYNDWVTFNHCCEALNDDPVDFELLDPCTPDQLAWGITEMSLADGKDTDGETKRPTFSEEVRRYIGAVCVQYGLVRPPDVLKVGILPPGAAYPGVFSDDPILFNGYWDKQAVDADELRGYISDRLALMIKELNSLPLANRDPQSWGEFSEGVLS